MSDSIQFLPPRGMRDFYPEDMPLRDAIFNAWAAAAARHGFVRYDSCVVESLELLKCKAGEEIVEQIYAFKDKSDRELALRAEMTPTLARMIVARQGQLAFPLKWFTIAQCFRYERMSKGRKREHYQWNLDCVGEDSVVAEAEVVAAADCALSLLGLDPGDVRIHVNSRALLSDLFAKLGIPQEHHAATFLALDKRGKVEEEVILALLRDAGLTEEKTTSVMRIMQVDSLEEVLPLLGEDTPAFRNVRDFLRLMDAYGIADRIQYDIAVVRGLGYYTGIVFEAFDVARKFRAIFGGGRYDNLLSDIGGKAASAVGLGFGDVVVAELLADKGRLPPAAAGADIAIGFMEDDQMAAAVGIAQALRRSGRNVDLGLRAEKAKAFFSRVGKSVAREAIYLGPDDVARGIVRIKDLASRTEREVLIAEVGQGVALQP